MLWIFQANPDTFNIDGFLATRPSTTAWTVRQHEDRIVPGDLVYIWRAAGRVGAEPGIIASARVMTTPTTGLEDPEARRFWVDPAAANATELRVRLRIERIATPKEVVHKEWLESDPICSQLQIVRQPAGTNFPTSTAQAERLAALWARTGVDWSREDSLAALRTYELTRGGKLSKLAGSPVAELALLIGRSVGGAYNKLMNFRSLDERHPREGLKGAGQADKLVWAEFYDASTQSIDLQRLDNEFAKAWGQRWVTPAPDVKGVAAAVAADAERTRRALTEEQLRERIAQRQRQVRRPPRSAEVTATVFERDPIIIALAKRRARNRCEVPGCSHPLFLKPDGEPYLEVHHLHTLAAGGLDVPENVACVCPSHHREIHLGSAAAGLREQLLAIRAAELLAV